MNNISIIVICASLVTYSCTTVGEYEELDNTIEHSEMSDTMFSERLGRPFKKSNIKEVQPSSAPSESIYSEKIEKPESETVHLLIHDDFKRFLKTMPVMTLRKLKNLTLSDPEAGHRYLLQLANEVSGKLNDPNREKLRTGLKPKDCSSSKQDPKCFGSRLTKLVPMGEAHENQDAHSKDHITVGQYNPQVSSGGVGFEFDEPADHSLLALAPGRNKIRKFQLRIKSSKPSSTLFSDSPIASDPFRPSAFSPESDSRFPFTPSPKDEGALADIITFGSTDFQDPIPPDRFQHFSPNSDMQYPQSQGAMGPYSWSIEPASFDKIQSETFLPPTAIYQAISQAEQMEFQEALKEQQQNFKHDSLRFHKDFKPYRNEGSSAASHLYSKFQRRVPESRPNHKASQSRPADSVQKYYPGYDVKPSANTLGIPPGPNYSQAFAPPTSQFIPDPSAFFGNGGGAGDYTPGYLPGPGFVDEGNYGTNANYLGQLMDQAKSYFGLIAKVTGVYNNQAMTRKILEVSIGILGFLAFGGYIAVLLFRPFIPDYLKFPYFPGTVNTTTVQNNGGLLGYFLGRSLKESDRVFVLDHSFLDKLEEVVKVAVEEGNRKNAKYEAAEEVE